MDFERGINYELCLDIEETADLNIKIRQKAEDRIKNLADEN